MKIKKKAYFFKKAIISFLNEKSRLLLDKDCELILLEANLYYGGCNMHQLSNVPIFGDKTEEILYHLFKNDPMLRWFLSADNPLNEK